MDEVVAALRAAAEKLTTPRAMAGCFNGGDAERTALGQMVAASWLAIDGRIRRMIDAYLVLGNDAEKVGDCRRAASYRSVANMLGVVVTGGEPVAVDFLARYGIVGVTG